MRAEIITIGDEILIGQIVDTNSAYIATALNKIGVSVSQITSIQDDRAHILSSFNQALKRSDLVIVTGGLGPTKDDITKKTFCEFLEDTLEENVTVLRHVEHLFKTYIKKEMLPANRTQALVPSTAEVLTNEFGTAPGMWLEKDNVIFISMPGVPYEMKAILDNHAIPRIKERYTLPYIMHRTFLTYGMGESSIAARIENFENNLPQAVKLAYLPSLGSVRLRLSCKDSSKEVVQDYIEQQTALLRPLIEDIFVGYESEGSFEQLVADLLVKKGMTLAIAESCTGGELVKRFTQHSGASKYLIGSSVTYATQSKVDVLGIDNALIKKHTVVSKEVAQEMAIKVRELYSSDIAISTTGNAGPTKGDADVPIGTVCIGIATSKDTQAFEFMMGNNRKRVIGKTINKCLELLKEEILKN